MMKLRPLNLQDAPLMLEWMHDLDITQYLRTDFSKKTLLDCEEFIISSHTDKSNLHLAIVSEDDEYMGTISLKNIVDKNAEFAICLRRSAMGSGLASSAMKNILKKGFDELGLETIYWYVSTANKRAIRFYDKNDYNRTDSRPTIIGGGRSSAGHFICLVSRNEIQPYGIILYLHPNITYQTMLISSYIDSLFFCGKAGV